MKETKKYLDFGQFSMYFIAASGAACFAAGQHYFNPNYLTTWLWFWVAFVLIIVSVLVITYTIFGIFLFTVGFVSEAKKLLKQKKIK